MEKFVDLLHMMQQLITDNINIYDFEVIDIQGNKTTLESFRGKIILIVNTASMCRFASQYEELQKLYKKHMEDGLVVLAFTSYEFGDFEFKSNSEIEQFVKSRYGVTFPIFQPIKVNGEEAHPLYQYLKSTSKEFLEDASIQWNFTKFLLNHEGKVVKRYSSIIQPFSLEKDILQLLNSNK